MQNNFCLIEKDFRTQSFHKLVKIFTRLEFITFSIKGRKHFERIKRDASPMRVKLRLNTSSVIIIFYILNNEINFAS